MAGLGPIDTRGKEDCHEGKKRIVSGVCDRVDFEPGAISESFNKIRSL